MAYHIVDISQTGTSLSVKHGQLICRTPNGVVRQAPMEDIGAILVNAFSAQIHNSLLIEAAKRKIPLVICDRFRPISLVLPAQRITDTLLTRAQIQTPAKTLTALWGATLDAKCANQHELVARLCPEERHALQNFAIALSGDPIRKEGVCARLYWSLFAKALEVQGFRRLTYGDGLNSLLNYGYAVLLLRVEQKLLAYGLDPLYGMGHAIRERAFSLAYDMMEPFRPLVDERIFQWVRQHQDANAPLAVDTAYKTHMHALMEKAFPYRTAKAIPLDAIIDRVIRSYRDALITGKKTRYEPWRRKCSKWGG